MSARILYVFYLFTWYRKHNGKAYKGCKPVCFNEWCDCELREMQNFPEWYTHAPFIGWLVSNTKKGRK